MTVFLHLAWCLLVSASASASEGGAELKVKPGEDVTLPCESPRSATIRLLEWNRPELKNDGYVFFYRNNRVYENYQLQAFAGRVELRNMSAVSEGDLSVILRNVSVGDTGTYECRVVISGIVDGDRSPTDLRRLVSLTVSEAGGTAENTWDGEKDVEGGDKGNKDEGGGAVGVGVGVFLLVAAVLVGIVLILLIRRTSIRTELNSGPVYSDCDPGVDQRKV